MVRPVSGVGIVLLGAGRPQCQRYQPVKATDLQRLFAGPFEFSTVFANTSRTPEAEFTPAVAANTGALT